ncbi:ionotropic receptor 21a-like [Penaeus japonicus]|uniref:ionotropic receptor 21a-like n=1 Tax=Penaeus japonicus TaxID=27405 RepID=UPI001C711D1D|nr:ionotropic receptor 21a-like [Penaeus japonicus]
MNMDPPPLSLSLLLLSCLLAHLGQGASTETQQRTRSPAEAAEPLGRSAYQPASLLEPSVSPSLDGLLRAFIENELQECDLVLIHDDSNEYEMQLTHLLALGNVRRLVRVDTKQDLQLAMGGESRCTAYLIFLGDHAHLLDLSQSQDEAWDYKGKYIVIGFSPEELEVLAASPKGRKTKHILGIVETSDEGVWALYGNVFYRERALLRVNSWRDGRFASPGELLLRDKTSDLRGAVLKVYRWEEASISCVLRKVATFAWEPNVFYTRDEGGLRRFGVDVDVVNVLGQVLNFSVAFVEPPRGELWGDERSNGSWSGMMGMLQTGQADLGAASIYVSVTRAAVVDFSAPYDSRLSCFMARTEPPLPRWQALAFPFHLWTWLALLMALALNAAFLYVIARGGSALGPEIGALGSAGSCLYYTFGMHCDAPQARTPLRPTTQLMVGMLWLYVTILTASYSTNLTAFIIVSRPPSSIETVEELRKSGLEVAGLGEFYRMALASAGDANLQGLTETYKGHRSVETILPKVLDGTSVFLQNSAYIEYVTASRFTQKGVAATRMMKECFAPYSIALAVQKHSPLKEDLDLVLGRLRDSGLIRQYFLQSLRSAAAAQDLGGSEKESEENGVIPLTLDHLQGIFLVACLGWGASATAFLGELLLG